MPTKIKNVSVSIKAAVAELLATAMFVYIGTGTCGVYIMNCLFIWGTPSRRVQRWFFFLVGARAFRRPI